ncbi:hypothetical protein GCM10009612_02990 [Streptomyces beijiangensis]
MATHCRVPAEEKPRLLPMSGRATVTMEKSRPHMKVAQHSVIRTSQPRVLNVLVGAGVGVGASVTSAVTDGGGAATAGGEDSVTVIRGVLR